MLVKVLSYIASLIGSGRHKPVLITGVALLFFASGVTIVASALNTHSPNASSVQEQSGKNTSGQQVAPSDLDGMSKQQIKDEAAKAKLEEQSKITPQAAQTVEQPTTGSTSQAPETNTYDVLLNTNNVHLGASAVSTITAKTSTGTSVTWTIVIENPTKGLTITPDAKEADSTLLRIKTDNAEAGSFVAVITAKDASSGMTVSKKATITIE